MTFEDATPKRSIEEGLHSGDLVEIVTKAREEVGLHSIAPKTIRDALSKECSSIRSQLRRGKENQIFFPTKALQAEALRLVLTQGKSAQPLREDEIQKLLKTALRLLDEKRTV